MWDFRRRIATLLLILGAGLLIVHLIDSQRSMQTMLIATLGILVFYAGIYLLMLRRN